MPGVHDSHVDECHARPKKTDNKSDLLSLVSFPEGKLPVRYLGLPLTSQRASERDFAPLIAKVDANIRKWNTRSLSSTGRLELIRSVIQGIEGFWFQAFPIHKSVLDRITTLCRAFLWGSKFCKVAWDDICKPKDEGGLGLRNSTIWNQALLAKCFWNIAANKETLWIQWVHSVYLQGSELWTWNPGKKDSHFSKKVAEIRDSLLQKCGDRFMIEDNLCDMGDIKATKVYYLLRSKGNIRCWMKAIWKPYIPPRYSFTVWLTLRGRLPTKRNLHFLHLANRNCEFCNTGEETAHHLNFLCENTALIWGANRNWLKIAPALTTLERAIEWINHALVVLIPKVRENPSAKDYRPIACSNVVYKIITKILSNRMAGLLPSLINPDQATFIKGRSIVDNILLAQHLVRGGNVDSVNVLAKAIKIFSQVSRLHVNPLKSNIFLAGEIKDRKEDILALVPFLQGKLPVRYLGLPLTSQRASERDFAPLVNKVDEHIRKWNAKTLSATGRLEFIRSVIQGIEGFWFQAFPIHKSVLDRITSLCRTFLWGSKFCKVAWEDICNPKDEGGLALNQPIIWNQALLSKNLWNIASNKETLWVQWVHSVYLDGMTFGLGVLGKRTLIFSRN
ncbi:unnamed protein product [Cuscuta campestris]|uniref:Reverse transcriptase zinc-binding domain-containing protein n=1 Tax=Cuscuta campestris TaxID=132261 RepID=A0A484MIG6_9ASTE|nr:unnamed protein product [Cuscuta campestris]